MNNKETIDRLNEIKQVVNSNSLEELIKAYPDALKYSICEVPIYCSTIAISAYLVEKLIKDIENGKVH